MTKCKKKIRKAQTAEYTRVIPCIEKEENYSGEPDSSDDTSSSGSEDIVSDRSGSGGRRRHIYNKSQVNDAHIYTDQHNTGGDTENIDGTDGPNTAVLSEDRELDETEVPRYAQSDKNTTRGYSECNYTEPWRTVLGRLRPYLVHDLLRSSDE